MRLGRAVPAAIAARLREFQETCMTNILIVDDNSENLSLLEALFKDGGYGVFRAKNGAEALDLALRTPPGLVISDILMPVMDGYELCRRWKADSRLAGIPFIFYTATYTDPKAQRFGLSLGADRFFVKPAKLEVLEAAVGELLAEGAKGAGRPPAGPRTSEEAALKEYNEVIFRKLQQKVEQLEEEVSARAKTQLELEAALAKVEEKSRELADFFCITSHDLRTPLVNIQGFSENLREYAAEAASLANPEDKEAGRLTELLAEKVPEALRVICGAVEKMHGVITGLLKVARFGKVELKPRRVDMENLVAGAVKMMYLQLKEAGAEVRAGKLPDCVADPEQLEHVFCNLIDNSIAFRHPSRKLVVEISGTRLGSGACSYTVADNGRGLTPEEVQGRIWEIFYRAAPAGSTQGEGVGLTISRRIVEKHGGAIKAAHAPGGGAAFTVELPAQPAPGGNRPARLSNPNGLAGAAAELPGVK